MSATPAGPLLFSYDGSASARGAIESARGLVRCDRALVVNVWQPSGIDAMVLAGDTALIDPTASDRARAETAARLAGDGARLAREAGFRAEPLAVRAVGSVWRTIVDVAGSRRATAIVIGSRGRSGVRSFLLGSVSTAVMQHADCPTLIVHHPGTSAEGDPAPPTCDAAAA
jgi:nucleotide-binding universal stress UspA family protein